MCHRESMRCGVHGRIADGVRAARTVGAHRRRFHGRPRTGRSWRHIPGWRSAAEPGVHAAWPPGGAGIWPEPGQADGRCGNGCGGPGERDSGRAGGAGAGHPGRDVALLLVSGCPGTACSTAGHAIPGSRSRSLSGPGSPAAAALGHRSCARSAVIPEHAAGSSSWRAWRHLRWRQRGRGLSPGPGRAPADYPAPGRKPGHWRQAWAPGADGRRPGATQGRSIPGPR
jgi:hypothetical protein